MGCNGAHCVFFFRWGHEHAPMEGAKMEETLRGPHRLSIRWEHAASLKDGEAGMSMTYSD